MWYPRLLVHESSSDLVEGEVMEKLEQWLQLSEEEAEAERKEYQEFFAAMILSRLDAGEGLCSEDCFTLTPITGQPCGRRVGHGPQLEFASGRVQEGAADGKRFSAEDSFKEVMEEPYIVTRAREVYKWYKNRFAADSHYDLSSVLFSIFLKEPNEPEDEKKSKTD